MRSARERGPVLKVRLPANYPQPLIGYGASAILGYAFATAALRFSRQGPPP